MTENQQAAEEIEQEQQDAEEIEQEQDEQEQLITPEPVVAEQGFDRDPATMSEYERNRRLAEQYGV